MIQSATATSPTCTSTKSSGPNNRLIQQVKHTNSVDTMPDLPNDANHDGRYTTRHVTTDACGNIVHSGPKPLPASAFGKYPEELTHDRIVAHNRDGFALDEQAAGRRKRRTDNGNDDVIDKDDARCWQTGNMQETSGDEMDKKKGMSEKDEEPEGMKYDDFRGDTVYETESEPSLPSSQIGTANNQSRRYHMAGRKDRTPGESDESSQVLRSTLGSSPCVPAALRASAQYFASSSAADSQSIPFRSRSGIDFQPKSSLSYLSNDKSVADADSSTLSVASSATLSARSESGGEVTIRETPSTPSSSRTSSVTMSAKSSSTLSAESSSTLTAGSQRTSPGTYSMSPVGEDDFGEEEEPVDEESDDEGDVFNQSYFRAEKK